MGYSSKAGRKPFEYASKSSHGYIINDLAMSAFLHECTFPKTGDQVELDKHEVVTLEANTSNPIENIVAIDGGMSEVQVKREFPSSMLSFLQFGALFFKLKDLVEVSEKPFIDPEDIARLNSIQRMKLAFPTRNITYKGESTYSKSARLVLHEFFCNQPNDDKFVDTLKWLIFEEFSTPISQWDLASCPSCRQGVVHLEHQNVSSEYTFVCPFCSETIYLTDVFRFHEIMDDELGGSGILGYLTNLLEQILLFHLIRIILRTKPALLSRTLFIRDGPLAFFGQSANLHKPARELVKFLFKKQDLFLAGLEKSGLFVEHADQIAPHMEAGSALILDNSYIYRYIVPGKGDDASPYGKTTYYGNKLIFKTKASEVYVATLPTVFASVKPTRANFKHLDVILANIEKLKCDMYESSLFPVALVNKLVSLSDHPSAAILEKFAQEGIA